MKKILIENWDEVKISGVRFAVKQSENTYRENYFTCTPMPLKTTMKTEAVVCGILEGWHHTPEFTVWETHKEAETFYYYEGTALMPFCDLKDGKPDLATAQIVRIPAGTQVEVTGGKAHFVAVAENDKFSCVVYCPEQDAPRVLAEESIFGVYAL